MIIVSACLLGYNYKYNGGNNNNLELYNLLRDRDIKPVCPEVDGGLPIPRPPAEIINGNGYDVLDNIARVMNIEGKDVSKFYLEGTYKMLENINLDEIEFAVLKSRSPSCGSKFIYSGEFNSKLKTGPGVGAAYLMRKGIKVFSEEEIDKIKKLLNKV
jgi:uncharacterized protein YbbK (DUF523 family)